MQRLHFARPPSPIGSAIEAKVARGRRGAAIARSRDIVRRVDVAELRVKFVERLLQAPRAARLRCALSLSRVTANPVAAQSIIAPAKNNGKESRCAAMVVLLPSGTRSSAQASVAGVPPTISGLPQPPYSRPLSDAKVLDVLLINGKEKP